MSSLLPEHARWQRNETTVNVDEETRQILIIQLGGSLYAVEGRWVKEILGILPITFVPGLAEYFRGIVNVRGDLESVVDLSRFLGLGSVGDHSLNRILLVRRGQWTIGFLTDYVVDMADISVSKIQKEVKMMGALKREFVAGEFVHKNETVILLDIGAIADAVVGEKEE